MALKSRTSILNLEIKIEECNIEIRKNQALQTIK